MTGVNKSITALQKMAPVTLNTPEEQPRIEGISPAQVGCNPHLATGTYSSPYSPRYSVVPCP